MTANPLSFGYCTNVHAGTTLEQAKANLLEHAADVRRRVAPAGSLPVGLWLASEAAETLIDQNGVIDFAHWLQDNHFQPYTLNGFPYGDFHQSQVKHLVYEPTWTCDSRVRYTLCLAEILDAMLPAGALGSISTLPLGWPHAPWHAENMKNAADHLLDVAKFLDRMAQKSGREVVIALEPEPGCVLNTAAELVEFFEHFLFTGPDAKLARRYLSVCHDICHSGVMFEPQATALEAYRQAGIRVGKVQVSSAVHVPWDQCVGDEQLQIETANQLRRFDEPKYLHQTSERSGTGGLGRMLDDLPRALAAWLPPAAAEFPVQPWRVHFHVPIFVARFERLSTTQADIDGALSYLVTHAESQVADTNWFTGHYEVETYAWPVLPENLRTNTLSEGIAHELEYFRGVLDRVRGALPA